jgi:pimeloyl-ACP methyl ester carboxylesterase
MNAYNDPMNYDNDASYDISRLASDDTKPADPLPYLDENVPYVDYGSSKPETQETGTSAARQEQMSGPPKYEQPQRKPRRLILYGTAAIFGALLVIFAGTYTLLLRVNPHSSPAQTAAPEQSFRYTSCPFKPGYGIIEGKNVRCGFLTVPEDVSQPKGRMIQLAVAIFKAPGTQGTQVPADPVVYLTGGPGGGLLNDLGVYLNSLNLNGFTMGHDLILLDQRGTGYSKPALNCPELDPLHPYPAGAVLAAVACHNRLLKDGINIQAYTTIADATDVHYLIHALGYKQVDLYGVSYGTRLALTVMRLFPADIRSVVLDSTVPTQLNAFEQEPFDTQHALNVLFHGCAISPSCNAAYPHLDQVFYQLVANLNAHPAVVQVDTSLLHPAGGSSQLFSGDDLVSVIFNAMYDSSAIPTLPKLITQISEGNYNTLSQFASDIMLQRSTGISDGMYYAVECGEDIGLTTEGELDKAVTSLKPQLRPGMLSDLLSELTICQDWGQKPVPSMQKQPVISSIPTLILSGEYDPVTPPSNGMLAAQTLKHGYFFLFPATGHGVISTNLCPNSIMIAFLQHPAEKPDSSCIKSMQEPAFE